MADKLRRLYTEFGQSMWYDNISRDLLQSGAIQALVDDGVRGLTSNPSIFKNAITGSAVYDAQLNDLAGRGEPPMAIYEAMAVQDIQQAADILRPVYDESGGKDGFVSLEVSPLLAHDTGATVSEALRLWERVDRPNLMIKVPATAAGLPAITELIAQGLNVNVTLIFSREMYARVIEAYLAGLERRASAALPLDQVASVASFFVSRVDTLVDQMLEERIAAAGDASEKARLESLKGQAGVANARLAYQVFKEYFEGERFRPLAERGARVQRPLWASTSTKNPAYSDVLYVDNLIGPDTVNTAPPETIEAFVDHGQLGSTIEAGLDEAQALMADLAALGIDMTDVTDRLLEDGISKFADPFNALLAAIEEKARALTAQRG